MHHCCKIIVPETASVYHPFLSSTKDLKPMDNELFLQENQIELNEIIKPFQKELNRRQKLADFLKQCMRSAGRNDFLRLDELLNTKLADQAVAEESLNGCETIFTRLREYSKTEVDKYRIEFISDLSRLGEEAGLTINIDFPRISILKGIEGEINFAERTTTINKKVLKSIDPRRIITALTKLKKQLYDRPFEPRSYIDGIYETYAKLCKKRNVTLGQPVPIQEFYLEYVISLQSKAFFTNMDKGKFKGYSLEQFAIDLWRYFDSGIGGTSAGLRLKISPGRNYALWLLDSTGERQQISTISFN
jgi:hypothetical protein